MNQNINRKNPSKKINYPTNKQTDEWQPESNQMYHNIQNRQENYETYNKNKQRKKKINDHDYPQNQMGNQNNFSTDNQDIKSNMGQNSTNSLMNPGDNKKKLNNVKNNQAYPNQLEQEMVLLHNNKLNFNNKINTANFNGYNLTEGNKMNGLNSNYINSNNNIQNNTIMNMQYHKKNIQSSNNSINRVNISFYYNLRKI